jgi:DNA polymerase III subunit delta'
MAEKKQTAKSGAPGQKPAAKRAQALAAAAEAGSDAGRGLGAVVGQRHAVGVLRAVLAGGRLANAYLFHGPWGVGKTTAALAFARALLCPRRGDGGGADACGACPGCHKSAKVQHPDLRFLFPVSGEEATLDETIGATLAALRTDPFHVFTYEKAASIRIGLTRELLKELFYKPYEAACRVVVIRDADRMREDQYSAMLKSLEEPGASSVWVLTTSRPERLPATIRSRCLRLRFLPLAEEEVERFLVERAAVPAARARLLAAVCAGSLGRALLWRDEDVRVARDAAVGMMRTAMGGDAGRMLAEAAKVARGWNRETLRRVLEFQILWLRDVLRLRYGGGDEGLVNRDIAADLRKIAGNAEVGEVKRRLRVLEEVGRAIEGNVNPEVAFFSGLARLGRLVPERADDWPEYGGRRRG